MNLNTLHRSERLKSAKSISQLFETGKSLFIHPIRLLYHINPSSECVLIKVGFAAPKKSFRRAIDRNILKRRMREAYRINKSKFLILDKSPFPGLEIMFIYQGKEIEDFTKISVCTIELLKKLSIKLSKMNYVRI